MLYSADARFSFCEDCSACSLCNILGYGIYDGLAGKVNTL